MTDSSKFREALLQEAQRFYDQTPALQTFAPWPTDLTLAENIPDTSLSLGPDIMLALDVMRNWRSEQPFHQAIQRAINVISWRQTYSEAEVGRAFLDAFAYFELFGPNGLFRTNDGRAYVGFWGQGLFYPWHHHLAEEIYAVVSGEAYFEAAGDPGVTLGPGECKEHASLQEHALRTPDSPVLSLVLWRGEGLAGDPVIS
jgi:mannose-6-phosphate isomerase-like protein (cupin superfamily)